MGEVPAQAHAADLAALGVLGSTGSNGSTPLQRVRSAFPGAEAVGELVAAGYVSVLDTVAALVWCALLQAVGAWGSLRQPAGRFAASVQGPASLTGAGRSTHLVARDCASMLDMAVCKC